MKAGLALGCHINRYSAFDRKNYFYPDLPKAYQITQFEYPLCSDGAVPAGDKTIRVSRIHMEEDAGKLTHDAKRGISYVDFNRCGVPLIEIVTAPDFRSVQEVQDFVSEAALRLKYAGVCDARLEQGSLRCGRQYFPDAFRCGGVRDAGGNKKFEFFKINRARNRF